MKAERWEGGLLLSTHPTHGWPTAQGKTQNLEDDCDRVYSRETPSSVEPGGNMWAVLSRTGHLVKSGNGLSVGAQRQVVIGDSLPLFAPQSEAVSQALWRE